MDFETRHNTEQNDSEVGSGRDHQAPSDGVPQDEQFAAQRAPLRSGIEESPDVGAIKIFLILAVLTAGMALLFRVLT